MKEMPQQITFRDLIRLQWQQFGNRGSNWPLVLLFLIAGWFGLYQGFVEKSKKVATIHAFRTEKDSLLNEIKEGLIADTTQPRGKEMFIKSSSLFSGLWYNRIPSYKTPVSTGIYNIGQSDVLTYYYLFAVENFEMQMFKQTEIANPLRSLAGHFDVSFWVVYLLPLLILLLTFNALSNERDNGNWSLIRSQGITEKRWLGSKLFVVAAIVLASVSLIAFSGTIVNAYLFKQSPGLSDALFFSTTGGYLFFWLSLFYFINSLRKPTAYNALVGGIAWILICLILPVMVSKTAEQAVPVNNLGLSTYSRRPQNPQIEESKTFAAAIIKNFARQNRAYNGADIDSTKPAFLLRTYHAYHWILHKERWANIQQYFNAIEKRQQFTNWSTIINPASSTNGFLTALADNDAAAYHGFIRQTEKMHCKLQQAFYPALFTDKPLGVDNYKMLPVFQYHKNDVSLSTALFFLLILGMSVLLIMTGNKNLK